MAKVGATLFLNLGSASGVQVGDRFEVRSVGESIVDPDTGENLGGDETAVGTIEVVRVVNDRLCEAKIVQGSGFQIGNRAVQKGP